jgi:hypothetical protein
MNEENEQAAVPQKPSAGLSVTVQLEPVDLRAYASYIYRGFRRHFSSPVVLMLGLGSALLCMWISNLSDEVWGHLIIGIFLGASAVVIAWLLRVTVWVCWQTRQRSYWEKLDPDYFRPMVHQVLSEGYYAESETAQALYLWPAVARFVEKKEHLIIHLRSNRGFIVPKRCFASPEMAAEYARRIQEHLAARPK